MKQKSACVLRVGTCQKRGGVTTAGTKRPAVSGSGRGRKKGVGKEMCGLGEFRNTLFSLLTTTWASLSVYLDWQRSSMELNTVSRFARYLIVIFLQFRVKQSHSDCQKGSSPGTFQPWPLWDLRTSTPIIPQQSWLAGGVVGVEVHRSKNGQIWMSLL